MTHTIISTVRTTDTLTLTTNTSTNVDTLTTMTSLSTGENTAVAIRPSMLLGIEREAKFLQNKQAGEESAREYIQATTDFQKLRN